MKNQTKQDCRKTSYQKVSFQVKLEIVQRVNNGQISINHAAKEYGISRATIDYWLKKLSTFHLKSTNMSKDEQIKKLKERIEALEFIKDFQQEIIADFEIVTGKELAKKYLPEDLAKEIEKKKRKISKENG